MSSKNCPKCVSVNITSRTGTYGERLENAFKHAGAGRALLFPLILIVAIPNLGFRIYTCNTCKHEWQNS